MGENVFKNTKIWFSIRQNNIKVKMGMLRKINAADEAQSLNPQID